MNAIISAFCGLSLFGCVWSATGSILHGLTAACMVVLVHAQVSRIVEAIQNSKK